MSQFRIKENGKYEVRVIYGRPMVRAYENGEKIDVNNWTDDGMFVVREFDTEAEVKAYFKGMDDMDGWLECYTLEDWERNPDEGGSLDIEIWDGSLDKEELKEKGYTIVVWPESQELIEREGFTDNCFLINDEEGLKNYGSSAYVVWEEWYNDNRKW